MMKKDVDWEKELKPKPFRNNSFTPQTMRRVEEQLKAKSGRGTFARRGWGMLAVAAVLAAGIAGAERSGMLEDWVQKPTQGVTPMNEPETSGPRTSTLLAFPLKDRSVGAAVSVPLTVVQADSVVSEAKMDTLPKLPTVTFALTEEEASLLQAVWVQRPDDGSGYLLLAPKDWALSSARKGSDRVFKVVFESPQGNPGQRLEFSERIGMNSGSILPAIGAYFPNKTEWVESEGFQPEKRAEQELRLLYVNEGEDSGFSRYDWTRQGEGTVASGAAYYSMNGNGTIMLRHQEMSRQGTEYAVEAAAILRFFEENDGVQRSEPGHVKEK